MIQAYNSHHQRWCEVPVEDIVKVLLDGRIYVSCHFSDGTKQSTPAGYVHVNLYKIRDEIYEGKKKYEEGS